MTKGGGGVDGYAAIAVNFADNSWGGLENNAGSSSLLDGSVDTTSWWFAVGVAANHGGAFPGPAGTVQKQVELRVCDETAVTTSTPLYATPAPEIRSYVDTSTPDFTCEFDYSEAATPIFTSLRPRRAVGSTTLTIRGVNFGPQAPSVHIGTVLCEPESFAEVESQDVLVQGGSNIFEIKCKVPALTAGWYHVKIYVPGRGFAAHPDDPESVHSFESLLEIERISPNVGSMSGGVTVTLHGAGFSTQARNNTVTVDVADVARPAYASCAVQF